jgi:hypothetical protein
VKGRGGCGLGEQGAGRAGGRWRCSEPHARRSRAASRLACRSWQPRPPSSGAGQPPGQLSQGAPSARCLRTILVTPLLLHPVCTRHPPASLLQWFLPAPSHPPPHPISPALKTQASCLETPASPSPASLAPTSPACLPRPPPSRAAAAARSSKTQSAPGSSSPDPLLTVRLRDGKGWWWLGARGRAGGLGCSRISTPHLAEHWRHDVRRSSNRSQHVVG